jgi:hypothetical protein
MASNMPPPPVDALDASAGITQSLRRLNIEAKSQSTVIRPAGASSDISPSPLSWGSPRQQSTLGNAQKIAEDPWKMCTEGPIIFFRNATGSLSLKDFLAAHGRALKYGPSIDMMIALQFNLGFIDPEWYCRIDRPFQHVPFLVKCNDKDYSLKQIIFTESDKAKLAVSYNTFTYATSGEGSKLIHDNSILLVEFTFKSWKTESGEDVRLIAPTERTSLLIIQQLLCFQAPTKVKIGSDRVAIASLKDPGARTSPENIAAIEVAFGSESKQAKQALVSNSC